MSRLISSLMQCPVYGVRMDDTVAQVQALLADKHLHWVPVFGSSQNEAIGVIDTADVASFLAQGRDGATVQAWQICSCKPIAVDIETPIALVARLMVDQGVHHVVVTDRNGLAGVVSSLDFVRTFVPAAGPHAGAGR